MFEASARAQPRATIPIRRIVFLRDARWNWAVPRDNQKWSSEINVKIPNHPAYFKPDSAPNIPVQEYDVIVVSALGRIFGGIGAADPIFEQGALVRFGPRENDVTDRLISDSCLNEVAVSWLERHQGIQLLRSLRNRTSVSIIVQPFPYYSEQVLEHPDWQMTKLYKEAFDANFYSRLKDSYLRDICGSLGVKLLDYPDPEWSDRWLTPKELCRAPDLLHPTEEYGRQVLAQCRDALRCMD